MRSHRPGLRPRAAGGGPVMDDRSESPSCHDGVTMVCPVCQQRFRPIGRRRFCSDACRALAYRRPPRRGAERASLSLWPVPGGRSPSMSATAVAAARWHQRLRAVRTFMRRVGLGDAARPATSPSRSPSSLIRRSSLDSCVSSDQALHAARPLGNFGDREWGISVIRSRLSSSARRPRRARSFPSTEQTSELGVLHLSIGEAGEALFREDTTTPKRTRSSAPRARGRRAPATGAPGGPSAAASNSTSNKVRTRELAGSDTRGQLLLDRLDDLFDKRVVQDLLEVRSSDHRTALG